MLGTFHHQPPQVSITCPRDASLSLLASTGAFGSRESQISHELPGMFEAMDVSEFTDGNHGCYQSEPTHGHEGLHGTLEVPAFLRQLHGSLRAFDPLSGTLNGHEVLLENGLLSRVGKDELS